MPQVSPPARSGRPRNTGRDRELLLATQDLLSEVGYDRLTIDAVASRCGAAKTTVYRRWAGKPELVADAVGLLQHAGPVPDTGSLRGDLVQMAASWHDPDSRRDAVIAGLLTAMAHDAGLRTAVAAAITGPRREVYSAIVARAAARGEIGCGLDLDLIGAVIPAMIFHNVTVSAELVDRRFIERVVDQVVLPALTHPRVAE